MMSKLRKNMAMVLWILVFAFIGTIVFSWGMGGFKGQVEPGVIAKINGTKLTREAYDQTLQEQMNMARQQTEGALTEAQAAQVREQVWQNMINQILLEQAREKAEVTVTDAEVARAVRQSPPPQITSNPAFQDSMGNFNVQLYNQVLADPQYVDFVVSVEQIVREQLLQQKMLQRITAPVIVSEQEARNEFKRQYTTAKASFGLIPARRMAADTSAVTEARLREIYRDMRDEFKVEASLAVRYILVPDEPSREDSLDAKELVQSLKRRVQEGESFEELARDYSEDPSAEDGGDLGWFKRGRMVPEFEQAAFDARPGQLVGPVLTQFGYHLIKVENRRGRGDNAEVKASHILIRVEQSPQTQEDLRARAEGFMDEARESSFEDAAQVYNLEIRQIHRLGREGFNPVVRDNRAVREFLFNRPVGDVSPVYMLPDGYAVFQATEEFEEQVQPFEDVRPQLMEEALHEQQLDQAGAIAQDIYGKIQQGEDFTQALQDAGFPPSRTAREFTVDGFVAGGVGRDARFTTAAFQLQPGEISEPVRTDRGYYIIRLDELKEADMSTWPQRRVSYIRDLTQKRQQEALGRWLEQQREEAKIKDFRYMYYTNY